MCFKIVCPSKFHPHSHIFIFILQERPLQLTSSPPYYHVKLILTYIAFTKIHTLISSMIIQPSHFFSHSSFPDSIFFKLSLNLNVKFAMKSSSYFNDFSFFFCTSCCQACIPWSYVTIRTTPTELHSACQTCPMNSSTSPPPASCPNTPRAWNRQNEGGNPCSWRC